MGNFSFTLIVLGSIVLLFALIIKISNDHNKSKINNIEPPYKSTVTYTSSYNTDEHNTHNTPTNDSISKHDIERIINAINKQTQAIENYKNEKVSNSFFICVCMIIIAIAVCYFIYKLPELQMNGYMRRYM